MSTAASRFKNIDLGVTPECGPPPVAARFIIFIFILPGLAAFPCLADLRSASLATRSAKLFFLRPIIASVLGENRPFPLGRLSACGATVLLVAGGLSNRVLAVHSSRSRLLWPTGGRALARRAVRCY